MAHCFLRCKMSLLAQRDRYCTASEFPLLGAKRTRCRSIGELRSHSTATLRFNVPKTGLVALFVDQLADGQLALLVMQLTARLSGQLQLSGRIKERRTVNIRSIRACKL